MSRGRPPLGPQLVDKLAGSPAAKQRMQIILETLTGARTIPAACAELALSESRFHELRTEILQAATCAAEPRPLGRPPTPAPAVPQADFAQLQSQYTDLKLRLAAAEIREEIALVMPHLLKPRRSEKKRSPLFPALNRPSPGTAAGTPPSSPASGSSST